jgi:hypothetical protein
MSAPRRVLVKSLQGLAAVLMAAGALVLISRGSLPESGAGGLSPDPDQYVGPTCTQEGTLPVEQQGANAQFGFSHELDRQWPASEAPAAAVFFSCLDEDTLGFRDEGDGTDTLYVAANGVTTEHAYPFGALSSGIPPAEGQPSYGPTVTSPLAPPPRFIVPRTLHTASGATFSIGLASSIATSDLTLKSTTCKTVDTTYVYSYTCFRRYAFTSGEGDPNYNYNIIWSTGSSHGVQYTDAQCLADYNKRCMDTVSNGFHIADGSTNWCKSSTDGCQVVDWAPGGCCTQTSDGASKTTSLSLGVPGASASISSTFVTYVDRFGLQDVRWDRHMHGWWFPATSCSGTDCHKGRGKEIWVERAGGGMFRWTEGKTRPTTTYYALVRDNYGVWHS